MTKISDLEYDMLCDVQDEIEEISLNYLHKELETFTNDLKSDLGKKIKQELKDPYLKPIKKTWCRRFKEWFKNKCDVFKNIFIEDYDEYTEM